MPVEVSPNSKSTPAEVTAQATKSTHEKPLSNLAGGVVEGPSTGKSSQQDEEVRNNPAESTTKDKLPSVSAASDTRRRPASANPTPDPLPNSVSVDQVNKRTLGIAPKPKGVPNPNEEEKTTGAGNPEELQHETALAGEIKALWSSQKFGTLSLRSSRKELEEIRTSLSKRLYNLKHLLVRTGREGKWTEFLRQQDIPRTTADRYVDKWKRSISPLEKRTSGAIEEPTAEEIAQMVKKLRPKLVRQLTTRGSINLFMAELGAALEIGVPVV
jgi:hypothetical protein